MRDKLQLIVAISISMMGSLVLSMFMTDLKYFIASICWGIIAVPVTNKLIN